MTAKELIYEQVKTAQQYFKDTVGDVKQENLDHEPGGTALPLGARYAHLIIAQDTIVNGMLLGQAPLSESKMEGKTGVDKPMPSPMDPDWSEKHAQWSHSVKVDLEQLRVYADEVFALTEQYIADLTDEDLEKEMDLSSIGMGTKKVASVVGILIIDHINNVMGEIAVLKGMQDMRGYPF